MPTPSSRPGRSPPRRAPPAADSVRSRCCATVVPTPGSWSCARPATTRWPPRGQGFCLFNNVAVAAAALTARGERVLIVDWDVHHGNGTQDVFWDDPNVLFVSTHQYPAYPGTGRAEETGGAHARGLTINFPLPPGATGDVALAALDDVVAPAAATFAPTWVLISAGFDAHRADPLADLAWTAGDYAALAARVAELRAGAGADHRVPRGRLRPRRAAGLGRRDRERAGRRRECGGRRRRTEWRRTGDRDRRPHAHARSTPELVEDPHDLVVGRRREVAIPLPDGGEGRRHRDAHHCVARPGPAPPPSSPARPAPRGPRRSHRRPAPRASQPAPCCPVATPSSTTITGRPCSDTRVRPARNRSARRASSRLLPGFDRRELLVGHVPARAARRARARACRLRRVAPIASSGRPGAPSLRTMITSRGASSARAIARRDRDTAARECDDDRIAGGELRVLAQHVGERVAGGVAVGERDLEPWSCVTGTPLR